jgi:glycine reductase
VHAGFDTTEANRDPDRLVPLDAARALVAAGRIGQIYDEFFTTTGVDTPVAVSTRMGQEIGVELRNAGVDAVILTGT